MFLYGITKKKKIYIYIYLYHYVYYILKYSNTLHGTYRSYIILNMFSVYITRSMRMYNINNVLFYYKSIKNND